MSVFVGGILQIVGGILCVRGECISLLAAAAAAACARVLRLGFDLIPYLNARLRGRGGGGGVGAAPQGYYALEALRLLPGILIAVIRCGQTDPVGAAFADWMRAGAAAASAGAPGVPAALRVHVTGMTALMEDVTTTVELDVLTMDAVRGTCGGARSRASRCDLILIDLFVVLCVLTDCD